MTSTVNLTHLDLDSVKSVLSMLCELRLPCLLTHTGEYKIHNVDITFRCNATVDDLIDVIEGNRVYIPCIYVLNKIDQISIEVSDLPLVIVRVNRRCFSGVGHYLQGPALRPNIRSPQMEL